MSSKLVFPPHTILVDGFILPDEALLTQEYTDNIPPASHTSVLTSHTQFVADHPRHDEDFGVSGVECGLCGASLVQTASGG